MPNKHDYNSKLDIDETFTILSGQQLSSALDLGGMTLVGLVMPGTLTGTAITFQSAPSLAGAYQDLYNSAGTLLTLTVAASRTVLLSPDDLAGVQFIKIKSGTAEGADRSIGAILRAL